LNVDSTWISPKYRAKHWTDLRFTSERDWDKATAIVEDRLRGRFFDLVEHFRRLRYSGFAVLALDCLLIETFEQFWRGTRDTPQGQGKDYFVSFLTRDPFGSYFQRESAEVFYDHFRNGILHRAEVKPPSLVKIDPHPLVTQLTDPRGLIINRNRFHLLLLDAFHGYLVLLRDASQDKLRRNLRRKMDWVCSIPAPE
jgi:hypothetical protein